MTIKKHYLLLSALVMASQIEVANATTIVVTATRTSETIDETLAPVTVVTSKDIENSQAKTIADLLQSIPGVQFTQVGSRGSGTSMFIRGTNSNQSLVLIDGVRSGNLSGTSDLQYMDLNQIERIEVVRGSRSSLYGADAIGGVVQIFTKKGSDTQTFAPNFKLGSGSHNAFEGSAGAGGTINNTQYNFTSSYERTNGFDSTNGTSDSSFDDDNDAFRNSSQSFNVTHNFAEKTSLNFIYNHNKGAAQYDDAGYIDTDPTPPDYSLYPVKNNHQDFDIQKMSSVFKTAVTNMWNTTLQVGQFKNDQSNKDSYGHTIFDTTRNSANWQNDISLGNAHLFSVGIDYYDDKANMNSAFFFPPGKRTESYDTKALFAQDQFSIAQNDFVAGLRHEDNSSYGEHGTGDFSWGRNLTDDLRATASFGTGFRAPTLIDLYYPGYYSNPDLDPEKSKSYELGLKGKQQIFNWEANVYQIDIKDLIATGSSFKPENINKAQIQGLELSANTTIDQWQFGSNVTFLNPRDQDTGEILARRAKRVFNFDIDRSLGDKFDIGTSFIAKSHSREYNDQKLEGYGSVDIRGTYHATKEVDVQLKVNNIFDREYAVATDPIYGYGDHYADGANAFLTLTYKPSVK